MEDVDAFRIETLVCDEESAAFVAAFDILCDVFLESSVVHVALDIEDVRYREYFRPHFHSMVAQGLSLVAVDNASGEITGAIVGCDFVESEDAAAAHATHPYWITALYDLLDELALPYRTLASPGAGETVLVDMAAVKPAYGGRGIYRAMRTAFHAHAAEAGFTRVVGELSSAATQFVCIEQFGHRVVSEIAFADFDYQGTRPFASIIEPPTIQLVEGSLTD